MSDPETIPPFQPGATEDDRLIPLSALQHAVYCMRQAALIHLEQQWAENRFTAEGRVLHTATDRGEGRTRGPIKRVHALPVGSQRLALYGICDLVEIRKSGASEAKSQIDYLPVEFKRGKPKPHRADEVQLCAQALCLEEMTGSLIGTGALYYAQTKRRVDVNLDKDLRTLTEQVATTLRGVLDSGRTPPPTEHKSRCKACSLRGECQPDVARRGSASRWMERQLDGLLGEDGTE